MEKNKSKTQRQKGILKNPSLNLREIVNESKFLSQNLMKYDQKENRRPLIKKKKKKKVQQQQDLLSTVLQPKTSRSKGTAKSSRRSSSFGNNLYDKYRTNNYSKNNLMVNVLQQKKPKSRSISQKPKKKKENKKTEIKIKKPETKTKKSIDTHRKYSVDQNRLLYRQNFQRSQSFNSIKTIGLQQKNLLKKMRKSISKKSGDFSDFKSELVNLQCKNSDLGVFEEQGRNFETKKNYTQNCSQTFGALEESMGEKQRTTQDAQVSARDFINMQSLESSRHLENFDTDLDEPKLQAIREIPVKSKEKEPIRAASDLNIYNSNFENDVALVRLNFQKRKNADSLFNGCGFEELTKHCTLEQIHDICHEYYYGNKHSTSSDSADLYHMAKVKYNKALQKYQAEQRQQMLISKAMEKRPVKKNILYYLRSKQSQLRKPSIDNLESEPIMSEINKDIMQQLEEQQAIQKQINESYSSLQNKSMEKVGDTCLNHFISNNFNYDEFQSVQVPPTNFEQNIQMYNTQFQIQGDSPLKKYVSGISPETKKLYKYVEKLNKEQEQKQFFKLETNQVGFDSSPFLNINKVVQHMDVSQHHISSGHQTMFEASLDKKQPEQEPIDPVSTQKDSSVDLPSENNLTQDHYQQILHTMLNLDLVEKHGQKYLDLPSITIPASTKRLLVFDIDETMIHTIDERDPKSMKAQFKIKIKDKHRTEIINVNVRPCLMESLLELKKIYQIIAFTASEKQYADAILDFLDPDSSIFEMRLYRHNCVMTPFGYVKDLRVIKNRDLKNILMIDNSCLSFAFNVNNGVPILPFYDNTQDEELKHLTYYLNRLDEENIEDVRPENMKAFGLMKLRESYSQISKKQNHDYQCEPLDQEVNEFQILEQEISRQTSRRFTVIEEKSEEQEQTSVKRKYNQN